MPRSDPGNLAYHDQRLGHPRAPTRNRRGDEGVRHPPERGCGDDYLAEIRAGDPNGPTRIVRPNFDDAGRDAAGEPRLLTPGTQYRVRSSWYRVRRALCFASSIKCADALARVPLAICAPRKQYGAALTSLFTGILDMVR